MYATCMVYVCDMYVTCMVYVCDMYVTCMVYVWYMYVTCICTCFATWVCVYIYVASQGEPIFELIDYLFGSSWPLSSH